MSDKPEACPRCGSGDIGRADHLPEGVWKCITCGGVWRAPPKGWRPELGIVVDTARLAPPSRRPPDKPHEPNPELQRIVDRIVEARTRNLEEQLEHWKANHASVVASKRRGQEITKKLIAGLRRELADAESRIVALTMENARLVQAAEKEKAP